jgi:hypothetical protein
MRLRRSAHAVKRPCLVVLVLFNGCLFPRGSPPTFDGPANPELLCDPTLPKDGCPPCSAGVGSVCRDDWYSSALRCDSDAQCGGSGSCQLGYCVMQDRDGDGLDDDFEHQIAQLNFPRVVLTDDESCGGPHGVIYRARRHPQNPKRVAILYTVLYARDCSQPNGHVGDAESFAVTVDLDAQPGAPATVGLQAWAHPGAACHFTSACQTMPGTNACAEGGTPTTPSEVVIYASRDDHANYLSQATCNSSCSDLCSSGARSIVGPLVNVGEPDHPLVTDLTTQGFVNGADGWSQQLLHFNPWGTTEFSGGGRLDQALINLTAPPGN